MTPEHYKPGNTIDRQAMAAFLYRFANPGMTAPACTTAPFADVPVGRQFCAETSWLKAEGITRGNTGNTYLPAGKVTRQAMAAFLYRLTDQD